MADPSRTTLLRTSTFDSDLARLTRTFDRVRASLSHPERIRLDWLKTVDHVVKHAQFHGWSELVDHREAISESINTWIESLDGEEAFDSRKKLPRTRYSHQIVSLSS